MILISFFSLIFNISITKESCFYIDFNKMNCDWLIVDCLRELTKSDVQLGVNDLNNGVKLKFYS